METFSNKTIPIPLNLLDGNFSELSAADLALDGRISSVGAASTAAVNRAIHIGADVPVLNEQTVASYTLQLSDWGPNVTLRMTYGTANSVVLPTYASVPLPIGFRLPVDQWGVGQTTIVPQSGVTLRSAQSAQLRAQYSRVWIEKQATNEWLVTGDLSSSGAPSVRVPPSISGGPSAGSVLTRVAGTWDGTPTPTITGQWYADLVAIGGQTGSTYTTANPGDVGKSITYRETASNTAGSATSNSNAIIVTSAAASKPVYSSLPVISGTPVVGNTLSTTNGTWSNSPTGYAYQWNANGVAIGGATSNTFLLTSLQAGTTVTVTVTASNASGATDNPATSLGVAVSGSAPQLTASSFPAIYAATGLYETGTTLTVDVGAWSGNPTFAYQWYRADENADPVAIGGATAVSYTTTAADADKLVSCAVIGTTTGGSTTVYALAVLIAASSGMPVNSVAPVVSGNTPIGSQLSCTTGTWTNSPTFAYQWKRDGSTNIGSNSSNYTTVSADGGHQISCVVTATANGLSNSQASSNAITVDSAGSGSISATISYASSGVDISSVGAVDWLYYITSTSPNRKSGGGSLITEADYNGTLYADTSTGISPGFSWTGGTPTASGSGDQHFGLQTNTGSSGGDGATFSFPIGTSTRTVDLWLAGWNTVVDVHISLSDNSAAAVDTVLYAGASPTPETSPGSSGTSLDNVLIRVTANAAASAQTLSIRCANRAPQPFGWAQMYFRGAAIEV